MHDTMPTTAGFKTKGFFAAKTKGFFAAKTKALFVFSSKRNEFSYRFSGIGSQCQIRCPPLQSAPKQKMIVFKIPFFFRSRFFKWITAQAAQCPVRCKRKDIFFNLEWDCNAQRVHVPGFFKTNDLFGHFRKGGLFSM